MWKLTADIERIVGGLKDQAPTQDRPINPQLNNLLPHNNDDSNVYDMEMIAIGVCDYTLDKVGSYRMNGFRLTKIVARGSAGDTYKASRRGGTNTYDTAHDACSFAAAN